MRYYAELDDGGRCIGVHAQPEIPAGPRFVALALEAMDDGLLGRVYAAGEWGPPPPPGVPQIVTMRQACRALHDAGLLSTVEGAIDAMDEPERTLASIDWLRAREVRRDNALVQQLASVLDLDDAALDALFVAAAAVPE